MKVNDLAWAIARLVVLVLLFNVPAAKCLAESAIAVQSAEEIIQLWNGEQHLYVKGELGLSPAVLASFESWLDENAPHWTVVLMRNSNGESYTAIDQRRFLGMDAVEYALGHGLPSRTPFGTLEHPTTGETDGAVFVLFLDERKFSYFASDAQDRRSLGESEWIGNLDQNAVRVMRSSGSIVDAAKATIQNINKRLDARIQKEVVEKERIARERRRAVEQVQQDLQFAREEIAILQQRSAELQQSMPKASGELTKLPIDDLKKKLAVVEEELHVDTVREMSQQMSTVQSEISRLTADFDDAKHLDSLVAEIHVDIEGLDDPWNVSRPFVTDAEEHISAAQSARDNADRGVGSLVRKAKESVRQAYEAVSQKSAQVARARARNALIRKTALAVGGMGLGGLVCGLAVLNRRRKPVMDEALEAFKHRDETVAEEMDKVLELFTRSDEILGSKEKIAARGYEGDTRRLSNETFESVDDLLIMSNEVQRVMDESRELIHPSSVGGKIANAFSGTRYERGVKQITGEPLKFRRDRGLPIVLEKDLQGQFENGELPEEVTLTFEQVFKAFRERTKDATVTLDVVENALVDVNDKLKTLQERVDEAAALDRELDDAAELDGFFDVPHFFNTLLPAAQADADAADEISGFDPVRAAQNQIPNGMRKVNNALSVAKSIQRARADLFPQLETAKPKLTAMGYDIKWMETRMLELSDDANWLFEYAAKQDVSLEAQQFDQDITDTGDAVERCVAMGEKLKATSESDMEKLTESISKARTEIAAALGISEAAALHEYNNDPDLNLATAREQWDSVKAAIHRGDIDAADASCEAMEDNIAEGLAIVEESLQALKTFADQRSLRKRELEAAREKLVGRDRLGSELDRDYAPAALLLGAGDPAYHDQTVTVQGALQSATDALNSSQTDIDEAKNLYGQGRLLQAVALLQKAAGSNESADQWMTDVAKHADALRAQSRENESELEQAMGYVRTLQSKVDDPRIMQSTVEAYARIENEVGGLCRQIQHSQTGNDPFAEAKPLAEARARITQLESQIHADHNAHAEATRAVRGAETELSVAQRLVRTASTDGIPDSVTTTKCISNIGALESQVAQVARQLDIPHGDWQEVNQAAAAVNGRLGVAGGELRGELNRARRAAEMLEHASRDVYSATRWSGPFGIRVGGSPGSTELERARRLLNQGNYSGMVQMARAAMTMAQHAVQQAEREVARRQREKQRAAEQARRSRMRRRSSSGFGGGSRPSRTFGGGSISRGSGSGFKRSGW